MREGGGEGGGEGGREGERERGRGGEVRGVDLSHCAHLHFRHLPRISLKEVTETFSRNKDAVVIRHHFLPRKQKERRH